jgi:hypothetical protein
MVQRPEPSQPVEPKSQLDREAAGIVPMVELRPPNLRALAVATLLSSLTLIGMVVLIWP